MNENPILCIFVEDLSIPMIIRILFITLYLIGAVASGYAEIRGVWLTTNAGLDWPCGNYDEARQKRAMIEILDKLRKAHFNLVLFQVQANGDVAWDSSLQPAMSSITGDGSRGLSYDVCRFVIDECHRRSMQCHAWIVPYRVGDTKKASAYSSNKVRHVIERHPEWCLRYSGAYYIDPANPEARKYLVKLYAELIDRYDFDGVNLDYTRYPGDNFPDDASFRKYSGGKMSKADWRRNNINTFVAQLYGALKKKRPGLVIGSAPIGTYKNIGDTKNSTAYDSFQQDPVQWIKSGNHDIVIPQMYWDETFGFSTHLSTWTSHCREVPVLVGLAPYKLVDGVFDVDNFVSLMEKARNAPGVGGVCFFRAEHVVGDNPNVKKLYRRLVETPLKSSVLGSYGTSEEEFVVEKFME